MLKAALSPSMMCANIAQLTQTLEDFEKAGIEYLHVDIMDGDFVPNITLGTDFCKTLRRLSTIPLDIHLMVKSPEAKLDWFDIQPGELVSVHYESTAHIHRAIKAIKERGAKAMVALNPATPLSALDWLVGEIDGVLIMSVNPGFAGQKIINCAFDKVKTLRAYLDTCARADAEIEVDGNISFENAVKMQQCGANIFVGGSSSVFFNGGAVADNIAKLRALL